MDAHRVRANGIEFATLQAGPVDGPLVLLLHGFPELARSWRHQLPALAAAGYRAVAPDLRGYGETELRGPYDLGTLAADVEGLVHALGRERATLVGHDWGAVVAWSAAARVPHVVEQLAVLNGPPLPALAAEIRHNRRQARRSAYVAYFNLPVLPERTLTRDGGAFAARALVGGSHVRTAWTREELAHYTAALARPGRAAAALGYYRQAFRHGRAERQAFRRSPVACPVLVVWGLEDRFIGLGTVSAERLASCLAPGNEAELRIVEDAGHFVQNEAPQRVNEELLRWLPRLR